MQITDLLTMDSIDLHGQVKDKEAALNRMVKLIARTGKIANIAEFKECVLKREKEGTTGIGEGIAIPHGKSKTVRNAALSAMVVPDGVDFGSMDDQPVTLIFLIAAPDTKDNIHLDVLSRLSTLLIDESFTKKLRNAKDKEQFLSIINDAERKKIEQKSSKPSNSLSKRSEKEPFIVAVTACPTGIAHTYMAAESLENTANKLGISIKVETNGSGGAKNILTKEDIDKADCVIVAADKKVEMNRFSGKPLLQRKVADGIHKPDELLKEAISGNVSVYVSNQRTKQEHEMEEKGRNLYKQLMNGVSHMLPFVIGGGILIALAFLFDDYEINPSNFGMNKPFAAFLKTVGDTAFNFMLPILAGYIAMSIADRPGLMAGFVGGAIANSGITFTNFSGSISSGFLGALLAGFVAGYLVLGIKKLFSYLPNSLEGIKTILLYPVISLFLIGVIMAFLNPFVGVINDALNNALLSMGGVSKILLGAVVAGMMSVDMGGPVNKAAYVFGTASLAGGEFEVMAAVMAGGMVAPLIIALCATLFKNRFTKKERESAYINYIMGMSFISEGAIPFAAADPIRVLPACIIGSSITGALSMMQGCKLRAPHGGIFVLPVVSNWIGYFLAILIGTIVGALVLAFLKKPVKE